MTDAGFNEDGTKISASYEDELWGVSAALKFTDNPIRMLQVSEEGLPPGGPLALDELYAWVKPFGGHFKFTGGIFENADGIADYTDDIDDFYMGVFIFGEDAPFSEPEEMTGAKLSNGFLSEATFGPVTVQFLLGPNYSKEGATSLFNGYLDQMDPSHIPHSVDLGFRFLRIGGRIIADLGFGTVALTAKTFQWPMTVVNMMEQTTYGGDTANFLTFGANFDITAVENLGISLGYTGFLPFSDADGVGNVLWNGIDLRATWTGIEGLSLSTHNNVSFAGGKENPWMGGLGKDCSFFTLYNAIGGTKTLTEQFSVNAEIANVLSKTDNGGAGDIEFGWFFASATFISHITDTVEFDAGVSVDVTYGDESLTVFSVPVAIKISF
jgi:hypothetical protein